MVTRNRFFHLILFCLIFSWPLMAVASEEEIFELKVAKRDSLINICKKYLEDPAKWQEVSKLNNLKNPNLIYPGQTLKVPVRLLKGTPLDARVTFIKGEVLFQEKEGDEWTKLKLNDRILQGSTIKSGDKSAVEITFEDGASFFIRSNTTLGLTSAQKKGSFYTTRKLFLQKGQTLARTLPVPGAKSRFEVSTRNAVAGVRGTEFKTSVDPEETTRVEVLRGTVELEAMNQKVEVNEGEGSMVRKGEPPLKPRKLLPAPAPVAWEPLFRKMPLSLKFEVIEGALSYRVMLARDRDFKDVEQEKVIGPSEKLEITGIDDGIYFLQSLSIDDSGIEGFPSRPLEIKVRVNPQPPFVESPVEGAEYRKGTVSFKWLNVKDASRYHVQVAEDREFNLLVQDQKDIKSTEWIVRNLNFKRHWFRVNSIADDGFEGPWSDPLSFTVLPPPPAPPVEKPEVDKKETHIRWSDLGKGIRYQFQMARDAKFQNILSERELEQPEITLPTPNEPGIYYVRVKAIGPEGIAGDFSSHQSFEVKPPPPPPVPAVAKPEVTGKEVRVRWGDLGKGIRYQLQMARDAKFQNILSERELEQLETTLQKTEEFGTYYVRVRGIGPEGIAGDFSSPQMLKITHGLPYVPLGILLLIGLLLLGAL